MTAAKKGASAKAEAPATADEQGFVGVKVDPAPNSAHSLASGPEGVPDAYDDNGAVHQPGQEQA